MQKIPVAKYIQIESDVAEDGSGKVLELGSIFPTSFLKRSISSMISPLPSNSDFNSRFVPLPSKSSSSFKSALL